MSETPVVYRSAPPLLGEHTIPVLEEILGLGRDELAALLDNKVIQARETP
jgi:crotonobetainyl-CoA:carnitine CoA-transferase CaiB-like acyl-CoA transferase